MEDKFEYLRRFLAKKLKDLRMSPKTKTMELREYLLPKFKGLLKIFKAMGKKSIEKTKLSLTSYSKKALNLIKKQGRILKKYIIANKLKITLSTTALILVTIISIGGYQAGNGYKLTFNGQDIGLVKDQKVFISTLDEVCEEILKSKGKGINFKKDYSIEKVRIGKEKLLDEKNIKLAIYSNIDYKTMAAIISVNGEEVAVVESKAQAEKILKNIQAPYLDSKDNVVIKSVNFADEVEIIEKEVALERISSSEEVLTYLMQGTDEIEGYEVVSGDNSWTISRAFDLDIRDMEAANPEKDLDYLYPGDIVNLTVAKPFINIETIEEKTYTEQIPYETTYKDDGSIYKGKQKIITSGKNGTKEIKAELTYINGVETSRKVLGEKVLKEPTTQVVAKGTKSLPPAQGSGAFRRPAAGRTGSYGRFGASRPGGRSHQGVDIGNSKGTPIYASDGGSVTSYIGYRGGYGYIVEINHGSGYSTRYAHLSQILVSSGQRVAKGDLIGRMGSTGNSSGPHLHFEIRKGGSPLNPFRFIK